mgnify:FL=1
MTILIKDAMILIHLAKATILEASCDHFGYVIIPPKVMEETTSPSLKEKYADALLIDALIKKGKIQVKEADKKLTAKANQFNIFGGEAESVALYWQEKADVLATDDDNVRTKKDMLELNLIGTPSIILHLFQHEKISQEKAKQSIILLRKIGWFSSNVIDQVFIEVSK